MIELFCLPFWFILVDPVTAGELGIFYLGGVHILYFSRVWIIRPWFRIKFSSQMLSIRIGVAMVFLVSLTKSINVVLTFGSLSSD